MSKKNKKKFKKKLNEQLQKTTSEVRVPLTSADLVSSKIETTTKQETKNQSVTKQEVENKQDQINIQSDLKKFFILSIGLVIALVIIVVAEKQTHFLLNFANKFFASLNIFQV